MKNAQTISKCSADALQTLKDSPSTSKVPTQAGLSARQCNSLSQGAKTISDWLNYFQDKDLPGPKDLPGRLADLQRQQQLDRLPEDLALSEQLRKQGRSEDARKMDQNMADRFQRMAEFFEKQYKRLAETRLEQLASALAKAKSLKQGSSQSFNTAARREKSGEGNSDTVGMILKIDGMIEDLMQLEDSQLSDLAQRLQNQAETETLAKFMNPIIEQLETMIKEIVNQSMLSNHDVKVPEKYEHLVSRYFKVLSDDLGP
jgi:hypothetical protein